MLVVAQGGRIQYEALLLAASLRASDPDFKGRLIMAEPQPGPKWNNDPRIKGTATREALEALDVEILPLHSEHFGSEYPYGNKIEALRLLPKGEPFVFLDSDTLITGPISKVPFDFDRPAASMQREGTWPEIELYGPGYEEIWGSLYDRFGLDMAPTIDESQPQEYWQRYMYFNAGWFFGNCGPTFGEKFTEYARSIRSDRPEELVCQELDPWLDQVALPLVIHALGGGRPGQELDGLDGDITCHWRVLPLLYARAPDRVIAFLTELTAPNKLKKVLKEYDPFKRVIYQGKGDKVRAMFDRSNLPRAEKMIRNRIKKANLWMR
ncbi:hypothetical protein IV417_15190 [Alphaproteobacteria bacterium KMM 3653]|uniref:Uncharacterized protein n=1 Tax=Harenicola maris TaxID=2841044 RepID=A0AAP2CRE2_9RHOB|nr:hypothetical protein [Harenicola maris]